MNLRWLFGNFTDPQYQLSRRDQFRLSNLAHARFVSRKAFLLRTAMIMLPVVVFFMLLKPTLALLGMGGQTGPYVIALAAVVLLFWPWSAWMYRSLYVGPIRRAMRDVGYDLCIACGYDLRGLGDQVKQCPECGTPRCRP